MEVNFEIRGYNPLYTDDKKAHKQIFDQLSLEQKFTCGSELKNVDWITCEGAEPPEFSALQDAVDKAFPDFIVVQSGPESFIIGQPSWILPPPK